MRKKQFLQFRRAMATLLAVAMIGQNTVMTTAENYVADNTAVVAEEQAQEPEVQVEESASPAVQESAPAAFLPIVYKFFIPSTKESNSPFFS